MVLAATPAAAEFTIPRAQYVQEMPGALSLAFCGEATYFARCFEIGANPCAETAAKVASACVAELSSQLPATLNQPADGQEWGRKIGACAGTKFEEIKAAEKKASPECQDASKWP